MAVKFIPNPVGIALIARTPAMQGAMLVRGEAVASAAAENAPFGSGAGGHYRDQIKAEAGVIDGKAGARVNAYKWTSGLIEFGTSDTPTFAPLRTGCDVVGLTLTGAEGLL